MLIKQKNTSGFTIVELLIVIVVIGILAAITIVAYNGIQTRAAETVLVSDLSGAAKQLEITKVQSAYPSTGNDLKKSSGTTYTYTYNSSENSFCLSGESSNANVSKYYVSTSQLSPKKGTCPVIADTWAVSNIATVNELRCTSSCSGSFLLELNNYSYIDGTVTELNGGSTKLFQMQYACAGATCSGVSYTITAQAPLQIAEEFDENWGQTISRTSSNYSWGSSTGYALRVRVPANASSGTAQIYISSASSTNSNLRMYSTQRINFTK